MKNKLLKLSSALPKYSKQINDIIKYSGVIENLIANNPEFEDKIRDASNYVKVNHLPWIVKQLKNKEASIYYGKGTRWCTSATISRNYFEDYSIKNVFLYYIITKNQNLIENEDYSKIAYAIIKSGHQEIFNSLDKRIFENDVKSNIKEYAEIMPKIYAHLDSHENTEYKASLDNMPIDKVKNKLNILFKSSNSDSNEIDDFIESIFKSSNVAAILYIIENKFIYDEKSYSLTQALYANPIINEDIISAILNNVPPEDQHLNTLMLSNNPSAHIFLKVIENNIPLLTDYAGDLLLRKDLPEIIIRNIYNIFKVNKKAAVYPTVINYMLRTPNLPDDIFFEIKDTFGQIPYEIVKNRSKVSDNMILFAFNDLITRYEKYITPSIYLERIDEHMYNLIFSSYQMIFDNTKGKLKGNISKNTITTVYNGILNFAERVNQKYKKIYNTDQDLVDPHNQYLEVFEVALNLSTYDE